MTVDEAADRLRQMLLEAGFDNTQPDPAIAWEVFKQFAVEPVDVETSEFWFEASDGNMASEYPAQFDFVRMFLHGGDEEAGWGEQLTAHFTAPPSASIGIGTGVTVNGDVDDPAAWFRAVEASPAFKAGLRYAAAATSVHKKGLGYEGWSFEVRID